MGREARKMAEQFPWSAYGDRTFEIHKALIDGLAPGKIQSKIDSMIKPI